MTIGERLREERLRLGYNQSDFAAVAGVTKTSQFNYEKGDRSPDAVYLAALAAVGLDVSYVVTSERGQVTREGMLTDNEARVVGYLRRMANPVDREAIERHAYALAESSSPTASGNQPWDSQAG